MNLDNEIYPGGFYSLLRHFEQKEVPYQETAAFLDSLGTDLDALGARKVTAEAHPDLPADKRHILRKWHAIRTEFEGRSELEAAHAIAIGILRRRNPPPQARDLFLQIWRERGDEFVQLLDTRWMISAATTFGDHGGTENQRRGGQGLSMLFDLIKLHDSERRLSGKPGHFAFPNMKQRFSDHPLAFDMAPYSLRTGDLDKHMLARLWRCAEEDAILRPLGFRMLRMVMTDNRSIFSRIQHYKRSAKK